MPADAVGAISPQLCTQCRRTGIPRQRGVEMSVLSLRASENSSVVRIQYPISIGKPTYWSEIAIVQLRAMGTNHDEDDSAASRGLLQRLLSPGSFRLAHRQGDDTTTSRQASGDDNDSNVEASAPGIQDNDEDDSEDEDYDREYSYWGRPFARTPKWFPPVTVPQEEGLKLLMSGEFGRIGVDARSRRGSANFSKAILSSRSKLRQTPKQDISNVRAVYVLEIFCLIFAGHHPEHHWYGCRVTDGQHILWSILCRFVRALGFTCSVPYPCC